MHKVRFPLFLALIASLALASPIERAITFRGLDYFYRWSGGGQQEYTPKGQEDLAAWRDMVTLVNYPDAKTGDQLANVANSVLARYKDAGAKILKVDASPATPEKPAEYYVVAVFPQHDFIEAVFARFRLMNGVGMSAIYSHREYGQAVGGRMSNWLKENGPATQHALTVWDVPPAPDTQQVDKR